MKPKARGRDQGRGQMPLWPRGHKPQATYSTQLHAPQQNFHWFLSTFDDKTVQIFFTGRIQNLTTQWPCNTCTRRQH